MCGDVQGKLAEEHVRLENKIEQDVIVSMNQIIDADIPNILKLKKSLNKHVLDKDSINNRYHVNIFMSILCKFLNLSSITIFKIFITSYKT